MKRLLAFIFLVAASGVLTASAQTASPAPRAKDLYTQYSDGGTNTGGRRGAKVSILLKRGNQAERLVSADTAFYSGDQIKLVLDINFTGYAAILGEGSTGKPNLLFPFMDGRQMVSHRVSPNAGTKLPRGGAWMVFDDNPGTEKITVVFSKTPVVPNGDDDARSSQSGEGASVESTASGSELDSIIAELSSKGRRTSKDLFVQNEPEASYYVDQRNDFDGQVIFTLSLTHRR